MSKEQENETAVGRWLAVGLGAFALGTGMLSGCGRIQPPLVRLLRCPSPWLNFSPRVYR